MISHASLDSSYRYCAATARREARNFYCAFLLLPRARRLSMCALYAFLRRTDDLADEPGCVPEKVQALAGWRAELDGAIAGGEPTWPGMPALVDTIARHGIRADLLHEVIEGVSRDVVPLRFATFDELAGYCYQVASVVGLCCLRIWGYRSQDGEAERLAEHCGIALQLTNIIRDVRDDACNGRIYLPEEDLARFGVAPDELSAAGPPGDHVRALLDFEGKRAFQYYAAAARLAPLVAPVGRPVLLSIVGIYRALLDEMARRDYNVFEGRIAISRWSKLLITARALVTRRAARKPASPRAPDLKTAHDWIAPPR